MDMGVAHPRYASTNPSPFMQQQQQHHLPLQIQAQWHHHHHFKSERGSSSSSSSSSSSPRSKHSDAAPPSFTATSPPPPTCHGHFNTTIPPPRLPDGHVTANVTCSMPGNMSSGMESSSPPISFLFYFIFRFQQGHDCAPFSRTPPRFKSECDISTSLP